MNNDDNKEKAGEIYGHWGVVKAFAVIAAISVISYKVSITPVNFVLDFPTLLSLLLAFFSVGLSALFYFKATETSNSFYDNTHKFTRDIAQLLAKMESGFGERLKHLDEGYSSMRDYLQTNRTSDIDTGASAKLAEEKEQAERTLEEKAEIINDLLNKAHIQGEEKENILTSLKAKEDELENSRREISKLKRQLSNEQVTLESENTLYTTISHIKSFTKRRVIEIIGGDNFLNLSAHAIKNRFSRIKDSLPIKFLYDLQKIGVVDENMELTDEGVLFMKNIVQEDHEQ